MFGINYKMWISENADKKVQEYLKILKSEANWGDISIGYSSALDERFDKYFEEDKCNHPKRMYRPGNTVICHFTPILPKLTLAHSNGSMVEESWKELCLDTRQISRGITDSIMVTLQSFGREVSLLPERENWSHVCGAELSGLGRFEKIGDMYVCNGQIGSLGAVITEVSLLN